MNMLFVFMLPGSCGGIVVASIEASLRLSACCCRPRLQVDDVEFFPAGSFRIWPISVVPST